MGFFAQQNKVTTSALKGLSADFLHRHGCQVCPLNKQTDLKNPHMEPVGSENPIIYFLGKAPTRQDDRKGVHFSGEAGTLLDWYTPKEWAKEIRWNNIARTAPVDRPLTSVAIECCRPSVIQDIERTKPKAIFGFGVEVLQWALKQSGIHKWCGRRIPIKIGSHACWFFPLMHPDYVLSLRKYFTPTKPGQYGSEVEFAFVVELKRAFAAMEKLPEPLIHTRDDALANVETITGEGGDRDVARVKEVLESFYDDPTVGFDYETNAKRPYKEGAKLLSVALANRDLAFSFALRHRQAKWTPAQLEKVMGYLKAFLYHARCRKAVHQLPFELEWSIFFFGRKVARAGKWGDSVSQAFILDERMKMGKPDAHSLEVLCLLYFGLNVKDISKLDRADLDKEDLGAVLTYNAIDAKYHRYLYITQAARLKEEQLLTVYKHALRRIPTVVLTQVKGIPINKKVVDYFYTLYTKQRKKIELEIEALPITQKFERIKGKKFGPGNTHNIKFIVQKILKKDVTQVDEKVLKTINHPIARLVLKWRKVDKLRGTYVMPYRPGHDKSCIWPDGKIHPILSTTRTRTWRTASQEPNSQNQPKRGPGKVVRQQVSPGGEKRLVAFDYAGIQARNVAMETRDKNLVKYFWEKYDIHTDWCNRIVKHYPQWIEGGVKMLEDKAISKEYRSRAKNEFVFPSFFGARAKSLSRYLGLPIEVAEALHEEFWDEFPDIKTWHKELEVMYRKHGYVTGLSGFRRRAPISPNELINSPIQADESLIVLNAMSRLSEMEDPRFQANMEIHDDLTFIWPKHEIEKNAEVVIREMIKCEYDWINVPLVVEMSVGKDWSELEAVGEFSSDGWDGKVKYAEKQPIETSGDTWADGTGWENHRKDENAFKKGHGRR